MSDVTEFQGRAASVATVKMFMGQHFSICDLDAIAKTVGRQGFLAGRDYDALRALHCINWADMGPELTQMVRQKCLDLLGLPPEVIDVLTPEAATPPRERPARLRLAFWRSK